MAKVVWTAEAEERLKEIHDYVAYRVVEGGDIHILGVFHGAMELKRYLRG